ncbi:MAG: response regulator [Spirochaetales bacterium]|nr:response regulator [Spirochaetales bacterium]
MNLHILILDTTTTIISPWKKVIAKNYFTDEAVGGIEALRKIKKDSIDLVIVNISLKSMNGVEAIGKIRGQHATLPIIVLFEKKDILDLKQAKAYGVNSLVAQPVDIRELLVEIGRFIPREQGAAGELKKEIKATSAKKTSSFSITFENQPAQGSTPDEDAVVDIEKRFYDGLSAISSNSIDEAIGIFQSLLKVTRIKRESWRRYLEDALFQLGQCYATKGDFDKSNSYYAAFVKKAPHNTSHKSALLYLGKNFLIQKKYDKAAYFLTKVANAKPFDSFSTQARKLLKTFKI